MYIDYKQWKLAGKYFYSYYSFYFTFLAAKVIYHQFAHFKGGKSHFLPPLTAAKGAIIFIGMATV